MTPLKAIQKRFEMPTVPASILKLLIEYNVVTAEMIETEHKITPTAKAGVFKLRRMLVPFEIEIHNRTGVGYWLDDDVRKRLHQEIMADCGGASRDLPLQAETEVQP